MKKQTTELGKIITEAREKKGISQRELSRQANMNCAEVSRIEAGFFYDTGQDLRTSVFGNQYGTEFRGHGGCRCQQNLCAAE